MNYSTALYLLTATLLKGSLPKDLQPSQTPGSLPALQNYFKDAVQQLLAKVE